MARFAATPLLLSVALSLASTWAAAEEPRKPATMDFKSGGAIRMNLPSGAVEVIGTADERITVSWEGSVKDLDGNLEIALTQDSDRKEAVVAIKGPSNRIRYRVEVPRQSNIVMRMAAGDCTVRGVRGDLTANLLAGNLEIHVAEPGSYRSVRGSVTSGGLSAKPWNIDKGGLFRSFDATGPGPHEINARVLAGQLVIRKE